MTIQGETLPSAILGDATCMHQCVYLYMYTLYIQRYRDTGRYRDTTHTHTHTHIQHNHTNTISYKRKIFQQKNLIFQSLDWIKVLPRASTKISPSLLEKSKLEYNSISLLIWNTLIGLSPTVCKMCTVPLRV